MNTDTARERLRLAISCLERDDKDGAIEHIDHPLHSLRDSELLFKLPRQEGRHDERELAN
jgi:hypothetical protein